MKSDRRGFLKSAAAGALLPSIGASRILAGTAAQASPAVQRPITAKPKNVVLMICDDLGSGDLGCCGSAIPTPNLDALAERGIRFTHFNTPHALCSASRAALLTGRYAPRSHTASVYFPNSTTGMDVDETTLADLFHAKGYRTMAIGKWHLGSAPQYLPTRRGFDRFFGVPYSVDMHPLPLMRDTAVLEPDTERDLLTQRYTAEAVKFIGEQSAAPFFLYVAYSYPHDPVKASAGFRGSTSFGDYGDSVHEIDWSAGAIVQALRAKGVLDDTLVLFTSDHGPWFQGCPGALRGRKGTTFEGGCRVPMIFHWPNGLGAGAVCDAWASHLDVLPTLASLCALDRPTKPLDGADLRGVLEGRAEAADRPALLYFAPSLDGGLEIHCARKGDWKLRVGQIAGEMYVLDSGSGHEGFWLARPELYNVRSDPAESYDVARFHPDTVQAILAQIRAQIPSFPSEVGDAFRKLQQNVASNATQTGAEPRPA